MKNTLIFFIWLALSGTVFAQADLSWKDNSTSESGFTIERQFNNGTFEFLTNTPVNAVSYLDNTAVNSPTATNTYCYRVKAFNSTEQTGYTNTACKTIPQITVKAPNAVTISINGGTPLPVIKAPNPILITVK